MGGRGSTWCSRGAKKNWKSADLVLAALFALIDDSPAGNQCYLLANDQDQAGDDLRLAKLLIAANPIFLEWLKRPKTTVIECQDGTGFLEVLPAQDAKGAHGKTFRFCGFDEVHAYRDWDILEAMQPDPLRLDAQTWITSYASLFHKPGVPLFDLMQIGRAGKDSRMLFSWYGGDFTTDPDFTALPPEARANPSRGSWPDQGYLAQQQRRLPAHKFRRLHLNLPGLPEGSAFQVEPVADAIERGVTVRAPVDKVTYQAFVDLSGGSSDDAVLAIGHQTEDGKAVLDRLVDQGQKPPFDPRMAIRRFVDVLREYRVSEVTGDRYAGQTFRADFQGHGITYQVAMRTKSQYFESLEPLLNGRRVLLLDEAELEQQLLGLVWRGSKIDHEGNSHDDWANAAAGVLVELAGVGQYGGRAFDPFRGEWVEQDSGGALLLW